MKTNDFLNQLTEDLKPVKLVKFSMFDILKVLVSGLFCVFAAVFILGLRTDINQQMYSAKFIIENILILSLGLLSIIAAFVLSVPSEKHRLTFKIPVIVFSLIIFSTLYSFLSYSDPWLYLGHGFSCFNEILSISILPAALLFYFIRQAAALRRDLVGGFIALAGVSFGLMGTQLTCVDTTPLHLVLWHIFPSLFVMACGVQIAKKILKRI